MRFWVRISGWNLRCCAHLDKVYRVVCLCTHACIRIYLYTCVLRSACMCIFAGLPELRCFVAVVCLPCGADRTILGVTRSTVGALETHL